MPAPSPLPPPGTPHASLPGDVPIFRMTLPRNVYAGIHVVEGRRAVRRLHKVWRQRDKQRARMERKAERKAWRRQYPWSARHPLLGGALFVALLLALPVLFVLAP